MRVMDSFMCARLVSRKHCLLAYSPYTCLRNWPADNLVVRVAVRHLVVANYQFRCNPKAWQMHEVDALKRPKAGIAGAART
jgi:hypothetical protein